ncbi:DUF7539 family protein [Natrinema caseinilyticum]|uniref:DUF7539 family protein n=1 Tax=Natrinema caseinilyticum TaxID=2961570 RepID=UPI0020C505F8|nr:hypothetical protein [Natrinema caseinilyticum]
MSVTDSERQRLQRARAHLEEWKFDARDRAFTELFEGPDAALTDDELLVLDRIDSDLTRQDGVGLWDADEYGIVTGQPIDTSELRVVCTYHPEIPYEGFRGEESLDEATREELNDLLWNYCERVAEFIQTDLESFLESTQRD